MALPSVRSVRAQESHKMEGKTTAGVQKRERENRILNGYDRGRPRFLQVLKET